MDAPENYIGCEHYKRKSKFVTPCCNKIYTCRFCHDENENHPVNRKDVTELVCTKCETRQKVQAQCQNCHLKFGKYTCLECKLFDDEEKNQFHCDGCGICRIGGRDRFFHCERCNMCLPIKLQNKHKCVENVSRCYCPVCLDDIHTSRIPCHIPDCSHLLHRTCFEELLKSGHYACPTCQTSLLDMSQLWCYLDHEIEMTPMPVEYNNICAEILCKDCHQESNVKFHVVGLKCQNCGSYNTCRTKGSQRNSQTDTSSVSSAAIFGNSSEPSVSSDNSLPNTSTSTSSTSTSTSTSSIASTNFSEEITAEQPQEQQQQQQQQQQQPSTTNQQRNTTNKHQTNKSTVVSNHSPREIQGK